MEKLFLALITAALSDGPPADDNPITGSNEPVIVVIEDIAPEDSIQSTANQDWVLDAQRELRSMSTFGASPDQIETIDLRD